MLYWRRPIAVFVVALLLVEGSAAAATTAQQDALAIATVNLYCRIKTAGRTYNTTGSGVFIHESGIILTNAHVAQYLLFTGTSTRSTKAECSIRQGSPAREMYKAELVYLSPNWAKNIVEATEKLQPRRGTGELDFALLRVVGAKRGKLPERFPSVPLNLYAPLKDGDAVAIAGYPAAKLKFKEIQQKLPFKSASSTITSVQSFLRPHQDYIALSGTELSAPGVSGGPIVRAGELAAIAVTVSGSSGKENASLRAITVPYIDRVLRAETGLPLWSYLSTANQVRVDAAASPFAELKKTIEKTFRNTKE